MTRLFKIGLVFDPAVRNLVQATRLQSTLRN